MNLDPKNYRAALANTLKQDADAGHPEWLLPIRNKALEQFLKQGFPHTKLENWRYTNLAPMSERSNASVAQPVAVSDAIVPATDSDSLMLVFINGMFSSHKSSHSATLANGVVSNMAAQLDTDGAEDWLRNSGDSDLAQLNLAMTNDGAVVQIPDNTELAETIHIIFSNTAEANVFPRVIIQLGRNAKATVVEHHISNAACVSTAITNISCGEGSRITYQKLQEEHAGSFHVAAQTIKLAKDSHCDIVNIDLGAAIARNDLRILLQGSGAAAKVNGLFLVDAERHADNHLRLEHQAPHTRSRAQYAGVMANKGHGVFNGMIHVAQTAQKTDAALNNKNLLLTPGAEIDTKPELEIYADDVKCAHGSTTGQLDAVSLFYLRSRGVPQQIARNMLVQAFALEVVQQLTSKNLREYIQNSVEQRLNELGAVIET
ncbi:MAG: Fe-S cluster assembly protein SufD [Gammaproteobacteria bacterium]|nr:Fe-S cluster assembly protein SufD [Gammaproteobacteria bacterium]